jgi:hypothetical protein
MKIYLYVNFIETKKRIMRNIELSVDRNNGVLSTYMLTYLIVVKMLVSSECKILLRFTVEIRIDQFLTYLESRRQIHVICAPLPLTDWQCNIIFGKILFTVHLSNLGLVGYDSIPNLS